MKIIMVLSFLFFTVSLFAATQTNSAGIERKPASVLGETMLGVETINTQRGSVSSIKLGRGYKDVFMFGFNAGFFDDFDFSLIGIFARHYFHNRDIIRFFSEFSLNHLNLDKQKVSSNFINFESHKGFLYNFLLGVSIAPFTGVPFDITVSYGFMLDSVDENQFSMIQDKFGNLGLCYRF